MKKQKVKKKELRVLIPEKLYNDFQKQCKKEYKTISEVIRSFLVNFNKDEENE